MSNEMDTVKHKLTELYAAAPRGPVSLRQVIDIALRTPEGLAAQAKYLNGDSPNGNSIMDRKDVADIVRVIAEKMKMAIPDSTKTIQIARMVMRVQRSAGILVLRTGRIDLQIEHNPTQE